MVAFGIVYALLYRSVAAWPLAGDLSQGVAAGGSVSEFIGPFNVLHQPLALSVIAWGFWRWRRCWSVGDRGGLERGTPAASAASTRAQQLRPSS